MVKNPEKGVFQYLHGMDHLVTETIELAARFVNRTRQNLFLTGKAGTGKTTFLQTLAETTHKKFVVVAPTGIAALNAKGVTIHSQFLLPPGTFIPDRNYGGPFPDDHLVYTQNELVRKHPINAKRKQVLRNIDLLIIDEVSMVRADLLDAVDQRLRHVKRNYHEPFGGVQVLMIGDLYQLPPVVRDNERQILGQYYKTPFFFEALALKNSDFTYLELDKIFRQSDERFIDLLNNLRNNCPTQDDIHLLNEHYRSDADMPEGDEIITLTTHNYKAENINSIALRALKTPLRVFNAMIEGDFPRSMYPVLEEISLKVGAQVMFVKNDPDGKFFNGKLATVVEINDDGRVRVELAGNQGSLVLKREVWENKRYEMNERTKELEETHLGSFTQYPVKLAWAITVHKSQGLTFERAVIDVGEAFAPGQVYVALSRLKGLEGLILKTRINPGVIATDPDVVGFSSSQAPKETLGEVLRKKQFDFLKNNLGEAFNFEDLMKEVQRIIEKHGSTVGFDEPSMQGVLEHMRDEMWSEESNLRVFRQQIIRLIEGGEAAALLERLEKAAAYYDAHLRELLKSLLVHIETVKRLTRTKTYLNALNELDLLFNGKREDIGKSAYISRCILEDRLIDKRAIPTTELKKDRALLLSHALDEASKLKGKGPKSKPHEHIILEDDRMKSGKSKRIKGQTFKKTYALFLSGMDIEAISKERVLKTSTIESHIARGIKEGVIPVEKFITDAEMHEINAVLEQHDAGVSMKVLYDALGKRISYTKISAVKSLQSEVNE